MTSTHLPDRTVSLSSTRRTPWPTIRQRFVEDDSEALLKAKNPPPARPALVLRWNREWVLVRCPFCGETHRHRFEGFTSGEEIRSPCSSLAGTKLLYLFEFPFEKGTDNRPDVVKFEIRKHWRESEGKERKDGRWYVAVDLEEACSSDDESDESGHKDGVDELSNSNQPKVNVKDTSNMTASDPPAALEDKPKIVLPKVTERDGPTDMASKSTYQEAGQMSKDSGDEGNTPLILASAKDDLGTLLSLLEQGTPVNISNNKGRTALMEAALWGRVKNVHVLLSFGAETKIEDLSGRTELSFAQPNKRSRKEREKRGHLADNTLDADTRRRIIIKLLESDEAARSVSTRTAQSEYLSRVVTLDDYNLHRYHTDLVGKRISLVAPAAEFPVFDTRKTIARLDRQFPFPSVYAKSGWQHSSENLEGPLIAGQNWTDQVFRICWLVQHELEICPEWDDGEQGKHKACHAEKQLIAYFINRHSFLLEDLVGYCDFSGQRRKFQGYWAEMSGRGITTPFKLQCEAMSDIARPPVMLKEATILISKNPCEDCQSFIKKVKDELKLTFHVVVR